MSGVGKRRSSCLVRACLACIGVLVMGSCSFFRMPPPDSTRPLAEVVAPLPHTPPAAEAGPEVPIWLLVDRLHTGIVFPYDWLLESGFRPPPDFGNPPYVVMSWGDQMAFSQTRWLSAWQIFRAIFTPSPAVTEMIPVHWHITEVLQQQRVMRRLVPREEGRSLAEFLNWGNLPDAKGDPQVVGESAWGGGVLLASRHSYYFPRICNVWTVQALEACGGDFTIVTALSASGVEDQAELPRNGFETIWPGQR